MMTLIGLFTGDADFSELTVVLSEEIPLNEMRYGAWINTIINLFIVGFVLFMISKAYKKAQKKKEEAPATAPAPTIDQELLSEIRDLLKK